MTFLTLRTLDHHAGLDSQFDGFWENCRDDMVNDPDGNTRRKISIEAAQAFLSAQVAAAGGAYPVRIDLDAATQAVRDVIADAVENDADCSEPLESITDDTHMAWLNARAPVANYGQTRPLGVQASLILAYEALEAQGGNPAALATLAALLAQQGCEHFDAGCTDGRLTHLCDIAIFG
jgi:hypothetical protein